MVFTRSVKKFEVRYRRRSTRFQPKSLGQITRILRILVSSLKRGWPSLKDLVLCERQIRKNLVPGSAA